MTRMNPGRSLVAKVARHSAVRDAALAALLGAIFLVFPLVANDEKLRKRGIVLDLTSADIALTVVSAVALSQARRHPLFALVTSVLASLVATLGLWTVNLAAVAAAIALFVYGVQRPRRNLVIAAAASSLLLGAAGFVVGLQTGHYGRQNIVLLLLLATAAAIAVASRRAAMIALEDRARRAEETRDETARRLVAEDRVRIARELHDVIAHHVAAISVQSGVAEHVIDRDPEAAKAAMHEVRVSARSVLSELQSVLGVLRQDESALPTAPAPGLAGIADLVSAARTTGLHVEFDGPPIQPGLDRAAHLAAYRLVQEALTNVRKHAPGATAAVRVAPIGDGISVTVSNGPPPPVRATANSAARADETQGAGLGLVGMRERVVAAGGWLTTGPTPDGGFQVEARLPVTKEDA
jgi:signal transduction histidine kinase